MQKGNIFLALCQKSEILKNAVSGRWCVDSKLSTMGLKQLNKQTIFRVFVQVGNKLAVLSLLNRGMLFFLCSCWYFNIKNKHW